MIDRKWEDPETEVGFLCETITGKWDSVGAMIIRIVHVEGKCLCASGKTLNSLKLGRAE